ncbi:MAG TPA: hypothetical protein VFW92_01795 [Candidatus Limnocylindrales bacterium]|nr:hypothetical protein [Candidatus Limnocylindrales bacterium]
MEEALRAPGPSFLRPQVVRLPGQPDEADRVVELGMTRPSTTDDGWWLAHVWAATDGWVVTAHDVGPRAGPPPAPPQLIMGPAFAGALAGLVAEEGGRQLVRLRFLPPADETRPWDRPLVIQLAIRWDPVRASTLRPTELATEALRAFGRAVEAAARPA